MKPSIATFLRATVLFLLALPALAAAADLALPDEIAATAEVRQGERDGLWEKTLVVRFAGERRTLSTSDGMLDAQVAINHAAHPDLWHRLGGDSKVYTGQIRDLARAVAEPDGEGPADA